ncbi:hypothetical protein EJ02DRAFT_202547 [Clathrospora elynae]|uniref:Microbial-type PARG catalytic domain-containing protein n=1 Tax=Clathrospora elynae TaxID=706981 RepID=A0A6A5SP13_9PLEO|nr:hypothetical protein EJ02DRAFT_202547 [Clathrospora elynae]
MGRTEKSQGLAPPAIRKDARAKQARQIINRTVPAILASNARARRGAEGSELVIDPERGIVEKEKDRSKDGGEYTGYVKRKGQGRRKLKSFEVEVEVEVEHGDGNAKGKRKGKQRGGDDIDEELLNLTLKSTLPQPPLPTSLTKPRKIRIITTDTLTAAHLLTFPSTSTTSTQPSKSSKKSPNPCILNMASPLRPGGGVLTGATSQEESLCARTTLLPSLKESFYRLPELGGIYTADVLVFRNALPINHNAGELAVAERWWIDVISAGMLRFPELEGEEGERRLSKRDREAAEGKIRAVMRMAQGRGVRKLVLGAWGCGAYGNPVGDVAWAFRRVLDGSPPSNTSGRKVKAKEDVETWDGIEEVVFAISNRKMAKEFAEAFGGGIEVEAGPSSTNVEEDEEEDKVAEELRTKIQEMESQLSKVWNADLKARMGTVLDGLKAQLKERDGEDEASDDDEDKNERNDAKDSRTRDDETLDTVNRSYEDEGGKSSDDGSDDDGWAPNPHDLNVR